MRAGVQVTVHAHSAQETGVISRLMALLDAKTGQAAKQRPRCLLKVPLSTTSPHWPIPSRKALPQTRCMHACMQKSCMRRACSTLVAGAT